jgi:hypothetical protein
MEGTTEEGEAPTAGKPTVEATRNTTAEGEAAVETARASYARATAPAPPPMPTRMGHQLPLEERFRAGIQRPHSFLSRSIPADNGAEFFRGGRAELIEKAVLKAATDALRHEGAHLVDDRFPGLFRWVNAVKFHERERKQPKFMLCVSLLLNIWAYASSVL